MGRTDRIAYKSAAAERARQKRYDSLGGIVQRKLHRRAELMAELTALDAELAEVRRAMAEAVEASQPPVSAGTSEA